VTTAVVTGSTRGIGYGLALELGRRGCDVVICGRDAAVVDGAVARLAAELGGEHVSGAPCDVTEPGDVQALWDHAAQRFGVVDLWINNAGSTTTPVVLWDVPEGQVEQVVATNVLGVLHGCRVAAAGMAQQSGGGWIYNVEGLGSKGEVQVGVTTYGATKAAVGYLHKALRKDLEGTGVRICAIRPGINVTEHLLTDVAALPPERWERTKKVMNILGDKPETTTPWLAERILANDRDGARIQWLTPAKITWRFATARFRTRDLFAELDIPEPQATGAGR
jgi:NAD(P)-dependent dehydrogenase (short-subunit alcohol dehydrogenase family)